MSWTLDGRPLHRILVTRLRYLGDIAMATVVLAALRRGDPALELGFLGEAAYAVLLRGHPDLARLHILATARRGADAAARTGQAAAGMDGGRSRGSLGVIAELRRARYDLAVDLFFSPRSAWLLRLAGIPARIGGTTSRSRRWLYTHEALAPGPAARPGLYAAAGGGLGDHLSRLAPLRHADGRPFLDWFEAVYPPGTLAPRVARPVPRPALLAALGELGPPAGPFTLLAPTATRATTAWPAGHWRALARELAGAGDMVVALSPPGASAADPALAAAIPPGRGGVLPPLALGEALAVVGLAARLVSVDGGIMHAAVAMGVPTVALFGPTDPALWFPYESLGPYRVLATRPTCHPCHRHACDAFVCLPDLAPARVLAALQAPGPAPRGAG